MNGKDIVASDEEENGNRNCPDTINTVLHVEDYIAKRPLEFRNSKGL